MINLGEEVVGRAIFVVLFLLVAVIELSSGQYGQQQYIPQYQYNQPYNPQYQPNSGLGLGYRDYGDVCEPPRSGFANDDSKLCDLGRGLTCGYGKCTCIEPGAIYRNGKCRARINRPCESHTGSPLECIINAECNSATKLCQCKRSLWSNDEGTACNSGGKLRINSWFGGVFVIFIFLHRYFS